MGGAFALWIDMLEEGGELSMWASVPTKLAAFAVLVAVLYFGILRAAERAEFMAWIAAKRPRF